MPSLDSVPGIDMLLIVLIVAWAVHLISPSAFNWCKEKLTDLIAKGSNKRFKL